MRTSRTHRCLFVQRMGMLLAAGILLSGILLAGLYSGNALAAGGEAAAVSESDAADNAAANSESEIRTLYTDPDTGYAVKLLDEAGLINASDLEAMTEGMKGFTAYGNALMATADANPYSTTEKLAVAYYDRAFGTEQGAVLMVDMENREVFWYSEGAIYDTIRTARAMSLIDNVYRYASKGDFAGCAGEAFTEAAALMRGERIRQDMKYIGNALLAVLLALLINYRLMRRATVIRPSTGRQEPVLYEFLELADKEKEDLGKVTEKSPAAKRREAYRERYGDSGSYSGYGSSSGGYSSSGSSRSSGGYSSSGGSRSSGGYSSSGSSSHSSGSSSHSSGSSSSHRGGGAGHKF